MTEVVISLLDSGQLDEDLGEILTALQRREKSPSGLTYRPGDRVVIVQISPHYLEGQKGTLVRQKVKRWAFRPDSPAIFGRFVDARGEVALAPAMFKKE